MKSQLPDAAVSFLSDPISDTNASLRCSIIIPVWRGGTNFAKCLSAATAAIRKNDEIIVVADAPKPQRFGELAAPSDATSSSRPEDSIQVTTDRLLKTSSWGIG